MSAADLPTSGPRPTAATRIHLITYNIWNAERWEMRAPALRKFLELFAPDVLCVQELRRGPRQMIDDVLAAHERVRDRFTGWMSESNIYWRRSMFSEIEHGAEDVEIRQAGHRRLFWVRLEVRGAGRSVLIATAHLTHQRHAEERASGVSPRLGETRRIIGALKRLNRSGEPLFFMGDLNDPVHPPLLLHEAGYVSCFSALGLEPPTTVRVYPTGGVAPGKPVMSQCVDWLVANAHARPLAAAVPRFYFADAAPSDHWPVQAVYELL
jgi:endonuclease/exonuclease/phosphatase family metal-dependent hydrolase